MADCAIGASDLFVSGEWQDAVYCWLTGGGDPTLTVVIPLFVFGTVLTGYFAVQSSPLIPAVVSLVLAGVIFSAFPASAISIIGVTVLVITAIGGLALTWRMGS